MTLKNTLLEINMKNKNKSKYNNRDMHKIYHDLNIPEKREKALKKLILSHLWLVVFFATKKMCYGVPLNTLISEGNIGLIIAAKKFNIKKGNSFKKYAKYYIIKYIHKALIKQSGIINKTARTKKIDLLNEISDIDVDNDVSLSSLNKFNVETNIYYKQVNKKIIDYLKNNYPRIEIKAMILRWGLSNSTPLTLAKIGEIVGRSDEWVRKIELKIKKDLKNSEEIKQLIKSK